MQTLFVQRLICDNALIRSQRHSQQCPDISHLRHVFKPHRHKLHLPSKQFDYLCSCELRCLPRPVVRVCFAITIAVWMHFHHTLQLAEQQQHHVRRCVRIYRRIKPTDNVRRRESLNRRVVTFFSLLDFNYITSLSSTIFATTHALQVMSVSLVFFVFVQVLSPQKPVVEFPDHPLGLNIFSDPVAHPLVGIHFSVFYQNSFLICSSANHNSLQSLPVGFLAGTSITHM